MLTCAHYGYFNIYTLTVKSHSVADVQQFCMNLLFYLSFAWRSRQCRVICIALQVYIQPLMKLRLQQISTILWLVWKILMSKQTLPVMDGSWVKLLQIPFTRTLTFHGVFTGKCTSLHNVWKQSAANRAMTNVWHLRFSTFNLTEQQLFTLASTPASVWTEKPGDQILG